MARYDAHVSHKGRTSILHCVEGGDDWKNRFQWSYGYYPEDHQLIRLDPSEYEGKEQQ